MDVSIIIPVRNLKTWLLIRAIDSVITSVGRTLSFEIIVVDDNSQEKVCIKEGEIPNLSKQNIRYIRSNRHVGIGASRNIGFHNSKGEYILFLDADDVLLRDGIDYMFNHTSHTTVSFSDHLVYLPGASKPILRKKDHWISIIRRYRSTISCPFLFCNFIVSPALIHRSILTKINGYPDPGYAGEQVVLYSRISHLDNVDFYHCSEAFYEYWPRKAGNSLSNRGLHVKYKSSAFIREARKRGYYNWKFSGTIMRRENDTAIYFPMVEGEILIPEWASINYLNESWELSTKEKLFNPFELYSPPLERHEKESPLKGHPVRLQQGSSF